METLEPDRFTLIREPARPNYRQRLITLGQASEDVVRLQSASPWQSTTQSWFGSNHHKFNSYCRHFKNFACEDHATRVVYSIEGVDGNQYLLLVSASVDGIDLFARKTKDLSETLELVVAPRNPQSDTVVHLKLGNQPVDQAYLKGLGEVVLLIQNDLAHHPLGATNPTDRIPQLSELTKGDRSDDRASSTQQEQSQESFPSSLTLSFPTIDAGYFSYAAGLLGAALVMAFAVAPGWLGFIVAFLPASLIAAWAVAPHA